MYPDLVLVNVSLISPEYRASYLKQAIYTTEDPTNHIPEQGGCHGNFSTHTGSPHPLGIQRPSYSCSSTYLFHRRVEMLTSSF